MALTGTLVCAITVMIVTSCPTNMCGPFGMEWDRPTFYPGLSLWVYCRESHQPTQLIYTQRDAQQQQHNIMLHCLGRKRLWSQCKWNPRKPQLTTCVTWPARFHDQSSSMGKTNGMTHGAWNHGVAPRCPWNPARQPAMHALNQDMLYQGQSLSRLGMLVVHDWVVSLEKAEHMVCDTL
jgi:hypothetical protein